MHAGVRKVKSPTGVVHGMRADVLRCACGVNPLRQVDREYRSKRGRWRVLEPRTPIDCQLCQEHLAQGIGPGA